MLSPPLTQHIEDDIGGVFGGLARAAQALLRGGAKGSKAGIRAGVKAVAKTGGKAGSAGAKAGAHVGSRAGHAAFNASSRVVRTAKVLKAGKLGTKTVSKVADIVDNTAAVFGEMSEVVVEGTNKGRVAQVSVPAFPHLLSVSSVGGLKIEQGALLPCCGASVIKY
jgi:hypothetical protein